MNNVLLLATNQGPSPFFRLTALLLIVLLFAGIMGGSTSFLVDTLEDSQKKSRLSFVKYNLLGLLSSLTVPLFLNTISSSLIEDAINPATKTWPAKMLIILGFCLVAAFSSRKFIDSITNAVFRGIDDAKRAAQIASLAAKEAKDTAIKIKIASDQDKEPDTNEPESEEATFENQNSAPLDTEQKKRYQIAGLSEGENAVITAMINSRYLGRAESGIKRDTGLSPEELTQCITSLIEKNLVAQRSTTEGFIKFYLTNSALGQVEVAPSG